MALFPTKTFLVAVSGLAMAAPVAAQSVAQRISVTVSAQEVAAGVAIRKVPLQQAALPTITVQEKQFAPLPENADTATMGNPQMRVLLGIDRKQPYALVAVPVRNREARTQLTTFQLEITEGTSAANTTLPGALAKSTAQLSALATGNWHRLSVGEEGFYKLDYAFLADKLKLANPVASNAIRLLGSGGQMLPEKNPANLPNGTPDTHFWMQDGGDGTFGPGDYLVFYSSGPQAWKADTVARRFFHQKNIFEDKSYYFLSVDGNGGHYVVNYNQTLPPPTRTVTDYDCRYVIDEDRVNTGKMGRRWVGEEFTGGSKTYSFDFFNSVSPVQVRAQLVARNYQAPERFDVSVNGTSAGSVVLYSGTGNGDVPSTAATIDQQMQVSSGPVAVTLKFSPAGSSSRGYLDFLEVIGRRSLLFSGGQLGFRNINAIGSGQVVNYQMANANSSTQVWDVTVPHHPVRMPVNLTGNTLQFTAAADSLHEYAAFDGSVYKTPVYVAPVSPQNLKGAGQQDYLIVTHPTFLTEANRLAEWHRQHNQQRVLVATTPQIYNEFSSGSQDIGAIRDFIRYYYLEAGTDTSQMPRSVLLLGDASYDYKDRTAGNTNYVPVYESSQSDTVLQAYTTDDYFGFLDAGEEAEGDGVMNVMDVGVGRIPAKTVEEARAAVDKIIHYKSAAALGPWRVTNTLVADDEDGAGPHLANSEAIGALVQDNVAVFNQGKIYMDNYPKVSTPAGLRAPEVNAEINSQVFKGTLFINYAGHGGIRELAQERILTAEDFNRWKNLDRMPFMITATCDFSQYDRPEFVSAGEQLTLKPDGGTIAMLTTTQAVYESGSRPLNEAYIREQLQQEASGKWTSFGEAIRKAKNEMYASQMQVFSNSGNWAAFLDFRKFALLGDPALTPNLPARLNAVTTDSVVDMATGNHTNTLSALGRYSLQGRVTMPSGATDTRFSGRMYVTIFDKQRTTTVRTYFSPNRRFNTRTNIVFKGRVNVVDGRFSLPFVVPKDLNYQIGSGMIQYYAEDGLTDVAGADTTIKVGGTAANPVTDNRPPVVRPFIGDSLFREGGLTGSNTALFGILEDETGINVSGNGIGHDLVAVIDGDERNPMVLNDYYESAPDTYTKGYVRYPVTGLADGLHTLTIRAWDMNNNSGEGSIRFRVAEGAVVEIEQLSNYPNPFADKTRFRFEHNHPDENLEAVIEVFSTTGARVRTINQKFTPTGSHSSELEWDGTNDSGVPLASGVFVYRISIKTAKNTEGLGYQKLVIAR